MNITSSKQLEQMLMAKYTAAIANARDEIYDIIDEFLARYYVEFDPVLYQRTGQLLKSLVKTEVKTIGNRVEASVYFDLDSLDYSIKTLKGIGTWGNTYHREGWTHKNDIAVFEMAASGSHGGWKSGTAIWDEPLALINNEWRNILKKMLLEQGIPIK